MPQSPLMNMSAAERAKYFAETVRFQDGKQFNNVNGQWVEVPVGTPLPPVRGNGSRFSFGGGGPGSGGIGVNLPLFGGGAERPPIGIGGGATGPGGATFQPNTPARPIPGSSLPNVSFTPPASQGNPTPPASSTPVSAGTPGAAGTTPPATNTADKDITDKILDALKKYGSNPKVLAALGTMLINMRTGRQEGRKDEQAAATINNRTNTERYLAELGSNNQDLNQRIYLGNNYDRNVDNAFRGSYAEGVEDINIPRPAGVSSRNITGGLRPSAFGNRKEIGAAMTKEAMSELLDPTRTATDPRPGTKRLPALPTLPEKIDIPEPGAFDTALEYLGLGASAIPFLSTLIDAATPKQKTPTAADLPIAPPQPLQPNIPQIKLGDAPIDPYDTQGLIDTLQRRRSGAGAYFPTL